MSQTAPPPPPENESQRLAAEAVHEKEERLRILVSQLPAILWTTDRELRFTEGTGAGREAMGETDDVRGVSLFAYFKTTDPEFPPIAAHRRALEGESVTYEVEWKTRTFQAHVEPLCDADDSIRGVVGVAFDITERKRALAELERSVALLQATIDSTADGILVVDAAGKMVHFNRRFIDMWKIPPEIVESRDENRALAFVLGQLKDPAAFVKKVMTVYAQPGTASHDVVELADGRLIERDSLPQEVDGKTVGRVWSFRDVTVRRAAEQGTEETLSLLKATLEATADGILVVDRDGRIVSFNKKFVEMWRIPDDVILVSRRREGDRVRARPAPRPRTIREEGPRPLRRARGQELRLAGVQGRPDVRALLLAAEDRRRDRGTCLELPRRHAPAPDGGHDSPARAGFRPHLRRRHHDGSRGAHRRLESGRREDVRLQPGGDARQDAGRAPAAGRQEDRARAAGGDAAHGALERRDAVRPQGRTAGIVDTVVVPLYDDFGRTLAALAVCRDVTDSKRLEEYRRRETNP